MHSGRKNRITLAVSKYFRDTTRGRLGHVTLPTAFRALMPCHRSLLSEVEAITQLNESFPCESMSTAPITSCKSKRPISKPAISQL